MNQMPPELAEEAPLDPAAERVRRKMVRLLAVSIGVMFVGIFAVLGAVVYQIGAGATPALVTNELTLPPGFVVEASELDGPRLAIRGTDADGVMRVLVFDTASGTLVGDHALLPEAPGGG